MLRQEVVTMKVATDDIHGSNALPSLMIDVA
jgi:hypothetical protein